MMTATSHFGLLAMLLLTPTMLMSLTVATVHDRVVRHHKWEVEYKFKSPDCRQKLAVTINGESPGPIIRAAQGDTVVVEVTNRLLTENVAIHWHGIRQIGTPWADGTEGVTQCPILPGETFQYRFVVDQAGTYMYHAHYGMQRSAGLNGMIVVSVPDGATEPFRYDGEHTVLLNDWWHANTYDQAAGLSSAPVMAWIGEPQSLLINGRGKFDCSEAAGGAKCNETSPECERPAFAVVPGKTYRIRIACVTSLSALNLEIEGHTMTVVEADGHYVRPLTVKSLNIYSGETYSVLLVANQDPSRNYWIAANVVARRPATPTGTGVLHYHGNHRTKSPPITPPPAGPFWNDTASRVKQSLLIRAHRDYVISPPPTADREIILLNTQGKDVGGRFRWSMNNVSYDLPHTPYLVLLKNNMSGNGDLFDQRLPPETYDHRNYDIYVPPTSPSTTVRKGVYRLKFGSVVDVVLQNTNALKVNNSETHPWHLHGYDFWVLGYGEGKFDPTGDVRKGYNLVDPIMKNTVPLHPYGWTAIRFRADNPGVWAFHCHIEAHFFMGMGIVFETGIERVGKLPTPIMGCGASKVINNP